MKQKNVHNKYEKIALFILAVSIYTIAASQNIKPHQFSVKTEKEFNAHAQTTTENNLGQQFLGRNKRIVVNVVVFFQTTTDGSG